MIEHTKTRRGTNGMVGAAVVAAACGTSLATGPLRPVALTGTDGPYGPGLGPGVTFGDMVLVKTVHPEFGTLIPAGPCISGTGSVVFGANVTGPGVDAANGSGIWAARGGPALSLVARRGSQIPGMPGGYTFGELFTAPQICDAHAVVFQSMVDGPDATVTTNEATFTERSGWVRVLIREGVTAVPESDPPTVFGLGPGNPAGDPWGNNQWVLSRAGDTALRCAVNSPPGPYNPHNGVFTDFGGPLSKHARGGDSWTDGVHTTNFAGSTNPRLNDSGAFLTGRLTDPAYSALWSNRARDGSGFGIPGTGPLHPIFVTGQIAPGTASPFNGVFNNGVAQLALNARGRVSFVADLGGGEIGAPGGVWSDGRFGVLQLVALSDAPAPGVPGEVFNSNAFFVLGLGLSDNNNTVIKARLKLSSGIGAGNDIGLWSTRSTATGQPGVLRLAVRESDPVPAGSGPDYDGLSFGEPEQFWVNASGLIAFVTLHNDFTRALWIERPDGVFAPLVKEFTFLDVFGDGTSVRLVTTIDVVQNSNATGDGRRSAFNDRGDVAVRLRFGDGSEGVFTTAPPVACSAPVVEAQPVGGTVAPGGSVTLAVTTGGTGPRRHQWRKGGEPIPGALLSTFTVANAGAGDAGGYDCLVTNACGSVTSATATITVSAPCAADFDGSGTVNVSDIFAFLSAWFARQPGADFDGSGAVDVTDIFSFLSAWFAGC